MTPVTLDAVSKVAEKCLNYTEWINDICLLHKSMWKHLG